MNRSLAKGLVLLLAVVTAGCRGTESELPPIHPNLNMDFQQKYDPQEASSFFADGRAMRQPVPGTVPQGFLREDAELHFGETGAGQLATRNPLPMTRELLVRGRERYNIYCTPCHGAAGYGDGIIISGQYGYTPAPSYHTEQLREVSDGYLYQVITNGVRTMPPYGYMIPVADRWAIVAYIRVLQRSQNAGSGDVPAEIRTAVAQMPETGRPGDEEEAEADSAAADTTGAGGEGAETQP